ncbi:uncharacterized protein LOC135119233 [Helicoverpa armigera]|uniref:F-box domain-containing protein n=1 Tax=Helicoverpa armigera TaxID=29058 RepID=A0A2W1AZW9_HELAM|nr:hypothetical protein B5X24_HaOG215633 [Helicoverpa armigera]
MSETSENLCHMYSLPAEILLNIFIYLPAKDLTKCREVCVRWNLIIDGLARSDDLWSKYCKQDFSKVYEVARRKAKPGLLWYNLYRSLALWQRLIESREDSDEFASASSLREEIRNFEILGNGVLGVHKKAAIVYYDIETLQESKRRSITGDFSRYTENEHVIVILSFHLHLFLIRKALFDLSQEESNVTFDNVKLYTLTENALYFVNLQDEIFVCNYFDDKNKKLNGTLLMRSEDGIMSLGYSEGHLNVLTFQRNIYTIINNNLVFKCSLGPDSNLLHQLQRYNFLEQLDWRVYFQWMYVLNHAVPEGPLRDIIIIRPYGDVYFVGSNWGVLRIYYAPYRAGEFNIFDTQPIKQYNFMERSDCPVLSTCPILQVDVFEGEDGHTVIVAMPKKIAVLSFTHVFKRTASLAMLPYSEVQKVKYMKISKCS